MDNDEALIRPYLKHPEVDKEKTYIKGWVNSEEDLQKVLKVHRKVSLCTFVKWSDDKKKKEKTERRILWKYGDIPQGIIPFCVNRVSISTCQYGKSKMKDSNENKIDKNTEIQNANPQTSKTVGCEAKLVIRYVTRYPDYKLKNQKRGRVERQMQLKCLTDGLKNKNVYQEKMMHIKIPLDNAHTINKLTGQRVYPHTLHADSKLIIKQYVEMGLTYVPSLKGILKDHVRSRLCYANVVNPADNDRSCYPSSKDIHNQIHQCLAAGQYYGLDQDHLLRNIENWKNGSKDRFFFRHCTGEKPISKSVNRIKRVFPSSSDDEEEREGTLFHENENIKNTFLFVHQTYQQSKLINKYGELILIDSTYKTSKYALPLYLLVVRTNVTYIPVAQFIVEFESIELIAEALLMLRDWNKNWKPDYFMIDYSDIEFQAVHNVFPKARTYLCQFHVEQAWLRWTRKEKTNLTESEADRFISMMKCISTARNGEDYETSVTLLKESDVFTNHENVGYFLNKFWLSTSIPEKWCRAFLEIEFISKIRINNGVEVLNEFLTNSYTKLTGTDGITSQIEILVHDFVPDQINLYRNLNYQDTNKNREYIKHIPQFLHNLQRNVVNHCLYAYAGSFSDEHVDEISTRVMRVKGEGDTNLDYTVDLGSDERLLSCTCADFEKSFLPCKHIFAVFRYTDYSLDDIICKYFESPYIHLDLDFISSQDMSMSNKTDQPISAFTDNSSTAISLSRGRLNENINILNDLIFLSQSADVMSEANQVVEKLINNFKATVNKNENISMHTDKKMKTRHAGKDEITKRSPTVGGLKNPTGKNLCFANALLQCMKIADIDGILQYHTVCANAENCFTCLLKDIIAEGSNSTEPLCRAIPRTCVMSTYKIGQQQDSHEFMHVLMKEIEQHCFGSDDTTFDAKKLFYGQLKSVVVCNGCEAKSSTSSAFSSFSLPIEKHKNITEAIDGFFKIDQVTRTCDSCQTLTATMKTTLEEIPKNIIIQLQRFGSNGKKIKKNIFLDLDICLTSYVEENKIMEDRASLFGIIVHDGHTLYEGHYYSFVKYDKQWYRVDDMQVKKVTTQNLNNIEGQSYLLFYKTLPS